MRDEQALGWTLKKALIFYVVAKSGLAHGQNSANGSQWIRNVNNLVAILGLGERLQEEGKHKKQLGQNVSLGSRGRGQQFFFAREERGRAK